MKDISGFIKFVYDEKLSDEGIKFNEENSKKRRL